MAETSSDIFEQVADMIIEEVPAAGAKTPALVRLLSLQLTKAEAKLALQIRTTGTKLGELIERTGIKRARLERALMTMADKGIVYYDSSDDPTYKVVGLFAPGFTETGLWGGVKYPFTISLAKEMHEVMNHWAGTMSGLGFPFAPVWAAPNTLPAGANPAHNLAEAIKDQGHFSVSACPCRLSRWIAEPGEHCNHLLDACIHTGDLSRWCVKHGMARELTFEETVELLQKCNKNGLVQTLNIQNSICNCCNDCCVIFRAREGAQKSFIPSPYLPLLEEEACDGCAKCEDRCPVNAIEADEEAETIFLDKDTCIGCGICVTACSPKALSLTERPAA
jgi:Pyruvate/2-oxoacid:ferredoxin oxidoreductase delta subunit